MTGSSNDRSRPRALSAALTAILVSVGILGSSCSDAASSGAAEAARGPRTVRVRRGPLRIVVREGGTLETPKAVVMKNQVYGERQIIELVPEGTMVKKGQVVCRLDAQDMIEAEVKYTRRSDAARSTLKQAEENRSIRKKQNREEIQQATTRLLLAERARDAFSTGMIPMERKRLTSELTIARAELERAHETHQATRRLFDQDIIPASRLQADELGARKARERLRIAEESLAHFERLTLPEEMKKLQAEVEVASIALARVRQECASELSKAEDLVNTHERTLAEELDILRKVQTHIVNCTIRAPKDGMLIYARYRRRGRDRPISLDRSVWQRQALLLIPDFDAIQVQLDIHESQVKQIVVGQPVRVRIDAMPEDLIPGKVSYVAPVPSTESSWDNPDYRVYHVDVTLDRVIDGLRPGMHAEVEILITDDGDALQLPLESVIPSGRRAFVHVPGPKGPALREIELGPHNERSVQVTSGLIEGDEVYLERPADAPPAPSPKARPFLPATAPSEND